MLMFFQSLDKLSKGDPKGLGRVYVSICVLPFPPPCTGMCSFNTRLISIRLSLLHPVVSSLAKAEIGGMFQVLKSMVMFQS